MVRREWGEFVYAPPAGVQGGSITLDAEETHHLMRVRRVSTGATVYATTGAGMVYECVMQADHMLHVVRELPEFGEPPVHLTLCMAMLKGDLNRDVADQAVQLGARSVVFFRGERSEGRLLPDKLIKLRKHAVQTIKQCGRARLPEVRVTVDLGSMLQELPGETAIFVADPATGTDSRVVSTPKFSAAALIVGPEGGLTAAELHLTAQHHARRLHMGERRLRAETAAVAGLAYLLNLAGEFRLHP